MSESASTLQWSRLTAGDQLKKLIGDRSELAPPAVFAVDQFGALLRENLDDLDMQITDETVLFHIFVTLATLVDVGWTLRQDGAFSSPQLSAVMTAARVVALALAEHLPEGVP